MPGRIQVLNRQKRFRICGAAVASFCTEVLRILGAAGPVLSVAFVGSRAIREMNHKHRGRDYATDVLSYSYGEMRMDGLGFLGEIVIAPEVAALQAVRYGMEREKELRKLLIHGILHLLGYNHETDRGRMNRIQARLMRRKSLMGLPSLMDKKEIR